MIHFNDKNKFRGIQENPIIVDFTDCHIISDIDDMLKQKFGLPESYRGDWNTFTEHLICIFGNNEFPSIPVKVIIYGFEAIPKSFQREFLPMIEIFASLENATPYFEYTLAGSSNGKYPDSFCGFRGIGNDTLTLNLSECRTLEEIHFLLKREFGFPDSYARDWSDFETYVNFLFNNAFGIPQSPVHVYIQGYSYMPKDLQYECLRMLSIFDELSRFSQSFSYTLVGTKDGRYPDDYCEFKPITKNPIILDFTGCKSYNQFHLILKKAFGFPDYYGKNWDALWDCLGDIFPYAKENYLVEVHGFFSMPEKEQEYYSKLFEIFDELEEKTPNFTYTVVS